MSGFAFGIITDTHIRAPGGDLSSPFPVNDRANARARYASRQLATLGPAFTIHLGDVVHPLPHMPSYQPAADEAHRILEPLKPDLHFVPGNHDIGDKPSPGMPAKAATPDSVALFEGAFGKSWGSFENGDSLFVMLNSSLVNSCMAQEAEQRHWLEDTLANAQVQGQRVFLFSHYPPFIAFPGEQDHYDNYAEPGRSWFLDLVARTGVEAVFSGHVHHFFFNRFRGVKFYCLPPTSFTRQDYAEMFPVGPAAEYGRDDEGKFGTVLVDVDEDGHRLRFVPTGGCALSEGETPSVGLTVRKFPGLVAHLRHAWHEMKRLPYNGPMEEFARKQVRNDYPLMRLAQLGITTIRTPASDLLDDDIRVRMADWVSFGMRFVVFTIGWPSHELASAIQGFGDGIEAIEVLATDLEMSSLVAPSPTLSRPVWLSKVTTSAERPDVTKAFSHAVSAGFCIPDGGEVVATAQALERRPDGIVFQVEWGHDVGAAIEEIARCARTLGCRGVANIRLANSNPAVANCAAEEIADTIDRALDAGNKHGVAIQCDTFEDVDRGYYPRTGFVDRRCNLHAWVMKP